MSRPRKPDRIRKTTHDHGNVAGDSTPVLIRFGIRLAILIALAVVPQIGFAQAFPRLLSIAGLFCVLWAVVRREPLLGPALTHWDEAAVFIVASWIVGAIALVQ
jgi:hypothetical protein